MRILAVDDHQRFIGGVRHILEKLDDQVLITEANRVQEAIERLEKTPFITTSHDACAEPFSVVSIRSPVKVMSIGASRSWTV